MLLRPADAADAPAKLASSRSRAGGACCQELSALAIELFAADVQPRSSFRELPRLFDATSFFGGLRGVSSFAVALDAARDVRSSLWARNTGASEPRCFFSAEANITPLWPPRSGLPSFTQASHSFCSVRKF